jgi:hypothetical protein
MRTIWKYPLTPGSRCEIEMPGIPISFKAGLDPSGELCVWALVHPKEPKTKNTFFVIPTGGDVPPEANLWLSTVTMGSLVFHVFTA